MNSFHFVGVRCQTHVSLKRESYLDMLLLEKNAKILKALNSSSPACDEHKGFEGEGGASERILNTLRCLRIVMSKEKSLKTERI